MAELTVPQIDFSGIGQLPQIYKQAQADQLRQQTLQNLGQGGTADATALLKSGDMSLAQLGINMQNRAQDQARQAAADARQAQRDAVNDQHWAASFGLQKRAADRADEGVPEKAADRAKAAAQYGITPEMPEFKPFVLTGKLPDTTAPEGFQRNPDGSMAPIKGGPADPETIAASAEAKQGGGMGDGAVEILARRLNGGDTSALQNVGRGNQGSKNLERIQNRAAQILQQEEGLSTNDAAKRVSTNIQSFKASQVGQSAEARTGATREANLNLILKATDAAIPAALEASDKVARTGWVPLNKIIQGGEVMTSNPDLKKFGMANLQLAEHWARAMNPTGVMRESDRDKALSFLSTADSAPTYKAMVEQLRTQITRERDAVRGSIPETPQFKGGSQTNQPSGQGNGADVMLQHARDAIAQGAPRDAVIQRLKQGGVDPSGL